MLDDIRNTAGDLLSGKMKEAEIALTRQESTILRLKIEGLVEQSSTLRDERAVIISKLEDQRVQLADKDSLIADLKAKLEEFDRVPDRLDDPTYEVLQLLFDDGGEVTFDAIRTAKGMSVSVLRFHLGVLLRYHFVKFYREVKGSSSEDLYGQRHYKPGSPERYWIDHEGRAHIMKNG